MMGERQTGHPALFYEFSLERPHYGNALAEHQLGAALRRGPRKFRALIEGRSLGQSARAARTG